MHDSNEKPIILVIVTFFLAMTLVYIAFFRMDGGDTFTQQQTVETGSEQGLLSGLLDNTNPITTDGGALDEWIDLTSTGSQNSGSDTDIILPPQIASGSQPLSDSSRKDTIKTIPIVKPRYGSIEMADLLGFQVKDAFVDTGATKYGYLGTGSLNDRAATVRRLGGNVLAIENQNDINKNLLRGDRVLFINIPQVTFVRLPTEQKLLVAMIVVIGEDKWLIEAKIDRYYASKKTMKTLFEQLYGKTL